MSEAKLFVAKENFEFRGVQRNVGDVFRITDEKAEALGGKVELSDDQAQTPSPSVPSDDAPETPEEAPANVDAEAGDDAPKAPAENGDAPAEGGDAPAEGGDNEAPKD